MRKVEVLLLCFAFMAVLTSCGTVTPVSLPPPVTTGPYSNASLNGVYVFSIAGRDAGGFFTMGGMFQADGNGNLVSGVEDANSYVGVFLNMPLAGTYSISPNRHGNATLTTANNTISLAFVLASNQQGLLIRSDANGTASGTLDRQPPQAFSNSAVKGAFAFGLTGINANGGSLQQAGEFSADGAGTISSGVEDVNSGGAVGVGLPLSGTYTLASNGRGSFTLSSSTQTLNFSAYMISAGHLKFMEIDSAPVLSGDSFQQAAGPYSNASLTGSYVFTVGGGSTAGPLVAGGFFTTDGNGNISGGTEDVNNAGTVSEGIAISGTYSMAANGRGTATLTSAMGNSQFALYPTAGGKLMMVQLDSSAVTSGTAESQQTTSLAGKYALNFDAAAAGNEDDGVAQLTADTAGNVTGWEDVNFSGNFLAWLKLSGTYSSTGNGRYSGSLLTSAGTMKVVYYVASSSDVFFVGVDPSLVSAGVLEAQQ